MRAEHPWLGGALLSWTSLYLLILGFDVTGIPIQLSSLSTALALETVAGFAFAWSRGWRPQRPRLKRPAHPVLLACLLPALLVLLWKTFAQPLTGPDNVFRWNHLAQLIVTQGSLANYPAHTPQAFLVYFWPDGIAPQASALQAWGHLAAGSLQPVWAALPMLLQGVLLLAAIQALASRLGGPKAGLFGGLAAAGCFLLHFSVELGQETGLTALGVTVMALHLCAWEKPRADGQLIAAACAGALAAAAREYAMLFPVLASAWLLLRGAGIRRTLLFTLVSLLPAGLWLLRNLVLTGSPLYGLDAAGLLPVNPVFNAFSGVMKELYGAQFSSSAGLQLLRRYLLIGTLTAAPGLLWLMFRCRDPRIWLLTALTLGTTACWLLSIPLTAGGLFYSMRVLSPLLALLTALSGCAMDALIRVRPATRGLLLVVLPVVVLDASLRALTVPLNPYNLSPRLWLQAGEHISQEYVKKNDAFVEMAARRAQGASTLCLSPGPSRQFQDTGNPLVPLWSPNLSFILDPHIGTEELHTRLRNQGCKHLLLSTSSLDQAFVRKTRLLERLGPDLRLVSQNQDYQLYDLP